MLNHTTSVRIKYIFRHAQMQIIFIQMYEKWLTKFILVPKKEYYTGKPEIEETMVIDYNLKEALKFDACKILSLKFLLEEAPEVKFISINLTWQVLFNFNILESI
jgi:hypothetical protein